MRGITKLLYVLLGLLMVDAIFEMSFVSTMVAFLHRRAGGAFNIDYNGGTFSLHGKPEHMLIDQGYTSNGAAGTALILVGIGGLVTFTYIPNDDLLLVFWSIISFLSTLLTLAALIYTQIVTSRHSGQKINERVASNLNNQPYPNYVAYPLDTWTPENWFAAVLDLDLASSSDRSTIRQWHIIMKGWRWNLIPMFVLGLAVSLVGVVVVGQRRAEAKRKYALRDPALKVNDIEYSDEGRADTPMLTPVARKPVPMQPQTRGVGA